jgi:hypothetical protein
MAENNGRTRQYSHQLTNPDFANLKMTTFALGGTHLLKSDTKSERARKEQRWNYLAVGLLGKFGVGFGLIPYSSVEQNRINFER